MNHSNLIFFWGEGGGCGECYSQACLQAYGGVRLRGLSIVKNTLIIENSGNQPYEHQWSSGRIVPCHGTDPGSIPGWCTLLLQSPFLIVVSKQTKLRVSVIN